MTGPDASATAEAWCRPLRPGPKHGARPTGEDRSVPTGTARHAAADSPPPRPRPLACPRERPGRGGPPGTAPASAPRPGEVVRSRRQVAARHGIAARGVAGRSRLRAPVVGGGGGGGGGPPRHPPGAAGRRHRRAAAHPPPPPPEAPGTGTNPGLPRRLATAALPSTGHDRAVIAPPFRDPWHGLAIVSRRCFPFASRRLYLTARPDDWFTNRIRAPPSPHSAPSLTASAAIPAVPGNARQGPA